MANEFSFPDAPAIESINLPAPPILKKGQEEKFLKATSNYLNNVFLAFSDISTAIRNGWLVQDARLVNLTVENVFAGSIITDVLYVGSEKAITLSGTTNTIIVKDKQATPVTRVTIGKLGTASNQYGIEVKDASGVVRFRTSDITEIDGAILKNATLLNAKFADSSVDTRVRGALQVKTFPAKIGTLAGGANTTHIFILTHSLGKTVLFNPTFLGTGLPPPPIVVSILISEFTTSQVVFSVRLYNPGSITLSYNYTFEVTYF